MLAIIALVPTATLLLSVLSRKALWPTAVLLGDSNTARFVGQELARLLLCRPGGVDGDASA